MDDERGKMVKRIGNFSLAVSAALLATTGSRAAASNPASEVASEVQVSASRVRASSAAPAGPNHISGLTLKRRFVDTYSISYADDYTVYSNYSNQSQ